MSLALECDGTCKVEKKVHEATNQFLYKPHFGSHLVLGPVRKATEGNHGLTAASSRAATNSSVAVCLGNYGEELKSVPCQG